MEHHGHTGRQAPGRIPVGTSSSSAAPAIYPAQAQNASQGGQTEMSGWIAFLLGILLGGFVVAYVFIPRFRNGFHNVLIAMINGLDKLLNTKKKPPEAPPKKFGVAAKPGKKGNGQNKKRTG
jgi:predicted lipid-binding transport protein (Tim44 family)